MGSREGNILRNMMVGRGARRGRGGGGFGYCINTNNNNNININFNKYTSVLFVRVLCASAVRVGVCGVCVCLEA